MSNSLRHALAIVVTSILASGASAVTQAAPPNVTGVKTPQPTIVRLAIDPAAEPRPALKYSLVTRLSNRKPGNAVPFYYRAILAYSTYRAGADSKATLEFDARLDAWTSAPLETFPRAEVRKAIDGFRAFDDLREGASREDCNWDWRLQDIEGPKTFEFILDEIQRSRGLARWLAVKARLEIAEGRYADAIETLRIGYQFGRDVAKTPILIPGLVGLAITSLLDEQVHALIAAHGSPNLYWALSELPRPLIDLRPAVEFELAFPPRVFPILKDPEHALHSSEQWADLITQTCETLAHLADERPNGSHAGWQARLTATGLALRGYTHAKRELIAAGHDAETIERMPVGQVIAMDEVLQSRYIADESRKWDLVSYAEGHQRLKQADRQLIQAGWLGPPLSTREVLPISSLLLPATYPAIEAMVRRDVSIAANRVVEALRMHAAHNGGKLPQSLDEVTIVPVPINPRFDRPFPYKLEGDKAILEVRRMTEVSEPLGDNDSLFQITIAHDRH